MKRLNNRAASQVVAALLLIAIAVCAAILVYVFATSLVSQLPNSATSSTVGMITATWTVSVTSSTSSYTTTTTSVTITGTTCDLLYNQYQGEKEYKAFGVAYSFVTLDQDQFMSAIKYYQFISYGGQRILYRGEISVANHNGTGIQGQTWEDALYFFDNGAAIIYPCP